MRSSRRRLPCEPRARWSSEVLNRGTPLGRIGVTGKKVLNESGVSRRDLLRLGARGIGFGLLGGLGPVPPVTYMEDALRMTAHLVMSTPEYQIV